MLIGQYVRQCQTPDFQVLLDVIHQAHKPLHHHYQLDDYGHSGNNTSIFDLEDLSQKGAIWFMAYDRQTPIGCVAIRKKSGQRYTLHKLAVLPQMQGLGVGKMLVWHAERFIFSQGVHKMTLSCLGDNKGLSKFYSKLGYRLLKSKPYKETSHTIDFYEKHFPHLVDHIGDQVRALAFESLDLDITLLQKHHIKLIYHFDEIHKQSNTGHLVQRLLDPMVSEWIWHRQNLNVLNDQLKGADHTFLVYPSPDALDLDQALAIVGKGSAEWLFIDATWQQAQKMYNQSQAFGSIPKVRLSVKEKSLYRLRKNQKDTGLCTLECVAHLLKEVGYANTYTQMIRDFKTWMEESGGK